MLLAEFLLKSLQLVFFLKVQFSKLFNRAPVDSCRLYIEKTCKTLNITSKISKEVLFLGKCEYFTSTDHLHSHYLRTRFRWLLLKFQPSFLLKPFQLLSLKENCYFGSKFGWIVKKNITCKNFFERLHVDVLVNTYYIKSSQIASARKVT